MSRFKQDCGSGCLTCAPPYIKSETCTSFHGSGKLRGVTIFPGYAVDAPGKDLNLLKFGRQHYVQNPTEILIFKASSHPTCDTFNFEVRFLSNGTDFLWDMSSDDNVLQQAVITKRQSGVDCDIYSYGRFFFAPQTSPSMNGGAPVIVSDTQAYQTLPTKECFQDVSWDTCEGSAGGGRSYRDETATITSYLYEPDTISTAIARESPTQGSWCTTSGTIVGIGGSSGGSTLRDLFQAGIAVVATIVIWNLTVGNDYELTVTLNRYGPGGGSFIDTIIDVVLFTAVAVKDTVEYDVPVSTDYDIEYAGSTAPTAA